MSNYSASKVAQQQQTSTGTSHHGAPEVTTFLHTGHILVKVATITGFVGSAVVGQNHRVPLTTLSHLNLGSDFGLITAVSVAPIVEAMPDSTLSGSSQSPCRWPRMERRGIAPIARCYLECQPLFNCRLFARVGPSDTSLDFPHLPTPRLFRSQECPRLARTSFACLHTRGANEVAWCTLDSVQVDFG